MLQYNPLPPLLNASLAHSRSQPAVSFAWANCNHSPLDNHAEGGGAATNMPPERGGDNTIVGLTPEQARAAEQCGPVLVLAGAGTGETKTLTAALAHRITVGGIAPRRILAVTSRTRRRTR
jgi:hypothetical protein